MSKDVTAGLQYGEIIINAPLGLAGGVSLERHPDLPSSLQLLCLRRHRRRLGHPTCRRQ